MTDAELLQERTEQAQARQRVRRVVSRNIRRFIAKQPKRLVNLDAIAQPPGQPAWDDAVGRPFSLARSLPRAWSNDFTNRLAARNPSRYGACA